MKILRKINYILYKIQKKLIVFLLLFLTFLSFLQVILRLFFKSGIDGADTFIKYLVLWVGFLGASLATYKNRHINIDVVSQLVRKKINKKITGVLINFISLIVSILFLIASINFIVNVEFVDSVKVFFMPSWILYLILPIVFFFMFLRFLQNFLESFKKER